MFEMLILGLIMTLIIGVLYIVYYANKTHESFLNSIIDIERHLRALRVKLENAAKVDSNT